MNSEGQCIQQRKIAAFIAKKALPIGWATFYDYIWLRSERKRGYQLSTSCFCLLLRKKKIVENVTEELVNNDG